MIKAKYWPQTLVGLVALLFAASGHTESVGYQIEEIVVTAQKREQNLNDVGIAVSAFTGDDIQRFGMAEPLDLAAQTPNLNINNTFGSGIANISIRGIGLNDYAVNNNPAAGIYIDEIYLVSPAMLNFQLFDLERVEVLKGPQGTLYGKNTTAGTVKFVSRKPTEETEGFLNIDYGRFDRVGIEGAVGGQLADGLGVRVAVQSVQQGEGYLTNRTTGNDVGEIDRTSWRVIADWAPNDKVNLVLNVHGGQDKSDPILFNINNLLDPADDGFFNNEFSSAGGGPIRQDVKSNGASLVVDWNLSEQWSVTSVTGFEDYSRFYQEDRDGSALVHLDGFYDNEIEQFSQEIRFTYVSESLVAIFGGFFGTDEVDTRDQFDATDLLPLFGLGGTTGVGNFYSQETDSQALFAHTEWQLSDAFRLNLGLRYTKDEKEFSNAFTFIVTPDLATGGGGLCPLLPAGPGVVSVSDGQQIQCFPAVSSNNDETDLSWKVGVDFTGVENTLIYGSISTGFKSGGFQGQLTFNPADLNGFDEENLLAYEVGFKVQLADQRLQINGAVFYYDFEDMQFYGPLFDSPFGPLFGIANAGDADVMGAEIDLNWLAAERLNIKLGLGYLDTEITSSVLPGVASGSELPNSPELNFNTSIDYAWNIGGSLVGDLLIAAAYKDEVSYDIVRQPPETLEDGYWLVNARIGISGIDGRWSAYLWGKNLTDERYRTQVSTTSVGFAESWGLPATYGIGFQVGF
ncbi:MAG: TonB-dependent receptor [Gammaproteobacteria bacterium]|nr:TonB-dependent receptor [Gammaproteobacteria bacterium]